MGLQLIVGNALLCFALWAAEPEDQPLAASIWRLPIMQALLAMQHVQKLPFAQGLMGADTFVGGESSWIVGWLTQSQSQEGASQADRDW